LMIIISHSIKPFNLLRDAFLCSLKVPLKSFQ
jgi:hypothetical protein